MSRNKKNLRVSINRLANLTKIREFVKFYSHDNLFPLSILDFLSIFLLAHFFIILI